MGTACPRCRIKSCCQTAEVSNNEEVLEDTKEQNSVHVSADNIERVRARHASLEEAKVYNQDAVLKLMQNLLVQRTHTPDSQSRTRSAEVRSQAMTIKLKVISSNVLQKMSVITITPTGYENSLRNERDGFVFFGSKKRVKGSGHLKGPIVNDFVIPNREAQKQPGRHFQIRYDAEVDAYFIKNLGLGMGLFMKIDTKLTIRSGMFIHIGESYFLLNILPKLNSNARLRVMLYGGMCTGQVFYFEPEASLNKTIRIGREETCEIALEDSLISKVQASIKLDPTEGWQLLDGNEDLHRPSTNGTWYCFLRLYLQDDTELSPGMVLKVGQTLFQVGL